MRTEFIQVSRRCKDFEAEIRNQILSWIIAYEKINNVKIKPRRVKIFEQHADNIVKNEVTIRIEFTHLRITATDTTKT